MKPNLTNIITSLMGIGGYIYTFLYLNSDWKIFVTGLAISTALVVLKSGISTYVKKAANKYLSK